MPAALAVVVILLALVVGAVSGFGTGAATERANIANECRQSERFTVKRTGFTCKAIPKPRKVRDEAQKAKVD